ncbi:predicted protein [Botrytis cinerea T4]|uniref:Uncharacterized protein n=1 Tax=Botryotinia fuckeliana (strain T4) TaxID=999810 RepID=G2YVC7_BOTF4|nr:predicted protein [Botrytis cinerea T4]
MLNRVQVTHEAQEPLSPTIALYAHVNQKKLYHGDAAFSRKADDNCALG